MQSVIGLIKIPTSSIGMSKKRTNIVGIWKIPIRSFVGYNQRSN
ncbi:MAG: hypothetical protein ACFIN2_00460 [Candidatus Walczuchella monophlebidarum]